MTAAGCAEFHPHTFHFADGSFGIANKLNRVGEKLKLEATVMGKNALACINNKVLSVGDKVLIEIGADRYECEVVKIEENAVSIRCGEGQIILKLSPVTKTVNSW